MDVMKASEKTMMASAAPVKSAMRVMEILEFFARHQKEAGVTEISDALDYPQSSTSMLLSSLTTTGYLKFERASRKYRPTLRVMLLGTWLQESLFAETSLMARMKELSMQTNAAVLLGLRQGIHVRFILSLPARTNALSFPVGVISPICKSAAGKVLLTHEQDDEVVRIAEAANAASSSLAAAERLDIDALLQEVRLCRRRGWAQSLDYPKPGRANIAMALPPIEGQPQMAVTLGLLKESLELRRDELIQRLGKALSPLYR